MERGLVTPEQQIVSVRDALATLRSLKPFRGQQDLVGDAESHLGLLLAAHKRGEVEILCAIAQVGVEAPSGLILTATG